MLHPKRPAVHIKCHHRRACARRCGDLDTLCGSGETFTVRKVTFGEGVERIYPINSPNLVTVEVIRHGKVRRARLRYLRDRVGKRAKVKERRVRAK